MDTFSCDELTCRRFRCFHYSILKRRGGWMDGAFSWWVTERNLLFSVKVQLWLHATQGELSWLWHKSSGAIWLILVQLYKTSRGHKAPKQGSMGVWNIILPQWPCLFSHVGTVTPLVSSTLIPLLLFKSPHHRGLRSLISCYRTKSLTPFAGGIAFVCGSQTITMLESCRCSCLAKESVVHTDTDSW